MAFFRSSLSTDGARAMALAQMMGVVAAAGALAYTPLPPRFSWDTLPVFYHSSNQSGPYNEDAIKNISRFPMVTIEKFQGPCGHSKNASPACHQEELIVAELRKVKAVNPNISTVFYYNSVLDFVQYDVHARMDADPSLKLHDAHGQVVMTHCPSPLGQCDVFDLGNPATRALFIAVCVNATQTGVVDGCFVDRAVDKQGFMSSLDEGTAQRYMAGRQLMLKELQQAVGAGPIVANHAFGPPHDNISAGTGVNFAMIEGFAPNAENLGYLQMTVANGRGVQAHSVAGASESAVAAFLIGAGYHSYFGMGSWDDGQPHWSPVFEFPLGAPYGPATNANGVWTRRFLHVNVTFDQSSGAGTVQGWTFPSGPTPPPPPPPPSPPPKPTPTCPVVAAECVWEHGDLAMSETETWEDCCAACNGNAQCTKWVHHTGAPSKNCHLHSTNATSGTGPASATCGQVTH